VASVSAIDSTASSTNSAKAMQALSTDDFLKLMITELTHQDPFEPMKNQELLQQMSTLQQLQASQETSKSFKSLMSHYDTMLKGQDFSTASRMIGQQIAGTTADGQNAVGKVVSVKRDGDQTLLQLDTGQLVSLDNLTRLGGSNSPDIIGQVAIGKTAAGTKVAGKIVSVEVNNNQLTLHLQPPDQPQGQTVAVPMSNASIINRDTADLLIGATVQGLEGKQGVVQSVQWTADDVILNIINTNGRNDQLSLNALTAVGAA
jgi:flagellar basal-body rod modification protein FlgD